MKNTDMQTYPNIQGHMIGDENRGGLRNGVVIENSDTQRAGTAGYPAVVTRESDGWIRFYIYTLAADDSLFPGVPVWKGPFTGLSEEIEETAS